MKKITIFARRINSVFPNVMDRAVLLAGGKLAVEIDRDLFVHVSDMVEIFPPGRIDSLSIRNYCDPVYNQPISYQFAIHGTAEKSKDIKAFCDQHAESIYKAE